MSAVTIDPLMSSPLVPQYITPVTTDPPMSSPLIPQSISLVTTDPPMSSPLVPQSISPVTTNPLMSFPLAVISEKSSSLTLKPSPLTALTLIPCKCHTRCNSRKNCPCKKSGVPCSVECHPGHECTNCVPLPEQTSVDLMLKETPSSPKKGTPSELLSKEQRSIFSTNAWLDDTIIDMGQSLLKAKYGHINGMQSVILGEKFAMVPQPNEFLQILNENGNHWVFISTIGCPPATVNVYDSLHGSLSSQTRRLIADVLQCKASSFELRYQDVQWQSNGSDCGLFALANASALCNGVEPTTVSFDQYRMQKHLLSCFENCNMMPFPVRSQSQRQVRPPRIETVNVYCVCRLTDDGTKMIKCDKCHSWFHITCVKVSRACLNHRNKSWMCNLCK